MRIRFGKNIARPALVCAVFLASAGLLLADDPPQYSPWSAPVNLGPIVNSSGYRGWRVHLEGRAEPIFRLLHG